MTTYADTNPHRRIGQTIKSELRQGKVKEPILKGRKENKV